MVIVKSASDPRKPIKCVVDAKAKTGGVIAPVGLFEGFIAIASTERYIQPASQFVRNGCANIKAQNTTCPGFGGFAHGAGCIEFDVGQTRNRPIEVTAQRIIANIAKSRIGIDLAHPACRQVGGNQIGQIQTNTTKQLITRRVAYPVAIIGDAIILPLIKADLAKGFAARSKWQQNPKSFAQFNAIAIIIADNCAVARCAVIKFQTPEGKLRFVLQGIGNMSAVNSGTGVAVNHGFCHAGRDIVAAAFIMRAFDF